MFRLPHAAAVLLATFTLGGGCDPAAVDPPEDAGGSAGGKADDIEPADFACQDVGGISLEEIAELDDPISAFLIKAGDVCPNDYRAMVEKLRDEDGEGCEAGRDLVTRVVSDDARIDPNPNNYRTVTSRACGSRPAHGLLFTLLSVNATEDLGARTFVEMQALDAKTGLYNYWVFGGGQFTFNGTSLDAAAGSSSCGACHRDGGVLMKELDEPWIHWESNGKPLPGADALFAKHGEMFGQRGDGRELEALVRTGNDAIVAARIGLQSDPQVGTVAKLLRPLFCSEQVNLDTAGTEVDGPVTELPPDLLVDPHWGIERGVTLDPDAYEAAVASAGQVVPGVAGRVDTEFKLVFPERAGFDIAYVRALVERGVIDEDFAADVLAIDFTRPLFSDARCDLLAFAPKFGDDFAAAEPEAIRTGFVTALQAAAPQAGTAAAELLEHLARTDDRDAHRARVDAFVAACEARDDRELALDVLGYMQLAKDLVRNTTSLIEHQEQLSRTNLPVAASARLDPATCTLVE
jgi:hypothetical protein